MSLKYVIRPMTEDDTFAVELIEQGIFSLPWSQKSFADACRNQTMCIWYARQTE